MLSAFFFAVGQKWANARRMGCVL